ncbi:hypothetical protein NW761_015152 [Fusarium oxysporum]|nr:hypothetical protein NW761_015152 [Fusarium oxysporum]
MAAHDDQELGILGDDVAEALGTLSTEGPLEIAAQRGVAGGEGMMKFSFSSVLTPIPTLRAKILWQKR